MGYRCLAVGACDRGDAFRLSVVKLSRHAREPQTRIRVGDEPHAELADLRGQIRSTEHGNRAAAHGFFDEAPAVGRGAFERGEQESRLDLAAVCRKPAEFHRCFLHRRRRSHLPNTCL